MKRTARIVVAFIILACGLLTGCVSNDPFDSSMVINYASVYGVHSLDSSANVNTAIISFSNRNDPSAYYRTQDKAEAKALYERYINKSSYYPLATNLNAITCIVVKDVVASLRFDSRCCIFYFDEISDAKTYFDALKPIVEKERDAYKTGIKNDYEYSIAYSLTANRAGNCDYLIGAYLRGNSVILINGTSPMGVPDTFCDYIFEKIGVIDPNTLKKK